MAHDSLVYLPESLAFLINIKKLVLPPCQILTLLEKKKNKVVEQCQFPLWKPLVTIKALTQVINSQTSTFIAVLCADLQNQANQDQQILEFSMERQITIL